MKVRNEGEVLGFVQRLGVDALIRLRADLEASGQHTESEIAEALDFAVERTADALEETKLQLAAVLRE